MLGARLTLGKAKYLLLAVPVLLALLTTACGGSSASSSADRPATVARMAGSDRYCITLTADTARRLQVRTAPVEQTAGGTEIPYSAVFYSATGEAWAYVSVKPLTFVREAIVVDRIEGDRATLTDGPMAGANVVTAGVPELHGIEYEADGTGGTAASGGAALAANTTSCQP